jgi:predicted amidophosphoribosyltransferase
VVNTLVSSMPRPDETRQTRSTGSHAHMAESHERKDVERRGRREHQTQDEWEPADSIKCIKCGAKNTSAAQFCISCGERISSQSEFTCPSCGGKISLNASFCSSCGSHLEWE